MHRAVELVRPRRVGEDALDTAVRFPPLLASRRRPPRVAHDLVAALRKILRAIVKNLGAIVRRRFSPRLGLACRFHGVANIFAIAQRCLAQEPSLGRTHFHAVAGVRPRLLPADVKLHRAINRRSARVSNTVRIGNEPGCPISRVLCEKWGFSVLAPASFGACLNHAGSMYSSKPFASALAPVPALAIATKAAGRVEHVGAIHPDHARL